MSAKKPQVSEKTKNLGIRATEKRRQELRMLAAKANTSVQGLFDHAMQEMYFGRETPALPEGGRGAALDLADITDQERAMLQLALRIIRKQAKTDQLIREFVVRALGGEP